jgi:hypothetical protein
VHKKNKRFCCSSNSIGYHQVEPAETINQHDAGVPHVCTYIALMTQEVFFMELLSSGFHIACGNVLIAVVASDVFA